MSILVTGGAGYIGSHTCIEMQNAGYDVIVIDNLDNSSSESLKRVEKITGKKISPKIEGYIHGIGMVLLLGLMAVILFKDVIFLFK